MTYLTKEHMMPEQRAITRLQAGGFRLKGKQRNGKRLQPSPLSHFENTEESIRGLGEGIKDVPSLFFCR